MLMPSVFIAAYVGVFVVSVVIAAVKIYLLEDSSMLGDSFASEQDFSRHGSTSGRLPVATNGSQEPSLAA